jgi:ATP-dependent protease HslVU (ClpYQ) ATPase subunit
MTSFSPREIVSELDRFIAKASGSEAVRTKNPTMKADRGLCQ